ncbi:hypothetical protein [Acetobacter sicerae]|uniref:hypothetical protein n=1 Tax=Acetobacter sicerae TaxID=85325 RepID=UPI00156AD68D|nr:hypothetical protein [Acetobacter sicerae]NHN93803.1 hypothetical protein [Acetobacter sicerae]
MSENKPMVRKEIWFPILQELGKDPSDLIVDRDAVQKPEVTDDEFFSNLCYLRDHRLCEPFIQQSMGGQWSWGGARITTRGIDYLSEDGGLTAELGIVAVKLDADTIKALICMAVDKSDASEEKKSKIKHAVQTLQGEALKSVTGELVKKGLQNAPDVIQWLGTAFGC